MEYVLGGFDIYARYGACAGERLLTENKSDGVTRRALEPFQGQGIPESKSSVYFPLEFALSCPHGSAARLPVPRGDLDLHG